jgi:phytoene dehydrogenase-like protein
MKDYAIVGSGIGGSSIAALLNAKGYDVALFEKEPYLGGCSSTFEHRGFKYNTGATTLAGYEDGHVVKEILDEIGVKIDLIETDPSIVVMQNQKITPRYKNFEEFFEVLDTHYPHPNNREFWSLVYKINEEFYTLKNHYYSNENLYKKVKSLLSFFTLFTKFQSHIRANAFDFTNKLLRGLDQEYLDFLESQILIVAQAPLREINFFTAALSLGYTFRTNHYVVGGFESLFEAITKDIKDLHTNAEIIKITQEDEHFTLFTKNGYFKAKNIVLNSTVYESAKLFTQNEIKNYYNKYEHLNNFQSSFMLYMTIKSSKQFSHHYQIIEQEQIKYTLSKALFVSFSDAKDQKITPQGYYSITASIHIDLRFWNNKTTYKVKKQELENILKRIIMSNLKIEETEIIQCFAASPKTFAHYLNRSQLGGNAMSIKNFLPYLPSNDTPIKNLYNVGDSVYAAQGWPGVMLGVKNLKRLLGV